VSDHEAPEPVDPENAFGCCNGEKGAGLRSRAHPLERIWSSAGWQGELLFWPGQKGARPEPAYQTDVEVWSASVGRIWWPTAVRTFF